MSEITRGVLRMPPELWGDDPLSVAQRHARYVEAADTIDRLQAERDALRADAERYRWLRDQKVDDGCVIAMKNKHIDDAASYAENIDRYIDAAIDAAKEAGK